MKMNIALASSFEYANYDNVVVNKNIQTLYNMDLKGKTIAGPRLFDNFELE